MTSKEYELYLNARQCGKSMTFENLKLEKELEAYEKECLSLRLDFDKALVRINELTSENRELMNRLRNSKNIKPCNPYFISDMVYDISVEVANIQDFSKEVIGNLEKELRRSGGISNEFVR